VGAPPPRAEGLPAASARTDSPAQRWFSRQPIGEDHQRRWGARLRRRQEAGRTQAPWVGRYRRPPASRQRSPRCYHGLMDRDGSKLVLSEAVRARAPRMELLWLDAGYNGKGTGQDGVEQTTPWRVETVKGIHWRRYSWVPTDLPPDQIDWSLIVPSPGFHVVPRRWVVERTFAWLSHHRRLSTDSERLWVKMPAAVLSAMPLQSSDQTPR
jgi:transposase